MLRIIVIISFFLSFQHSFALKDLSAEEWNRFPLLRHFDRFSQCLRDKDGAYCTARFEFVAEGPNELYNTMWNFSNSAAKHLNYTRGIYGYCLTRRCKEFYTGSSDEALTEAMGKCLNHTMEREYGLKANIRQNGCHRHNQQEYSVTWLDLFAAALATAFVAFAVIGTLYDLCITNKDPKGYLMCFSLVANWAKLKAPWPQKGPTARLMGINGIRTITSIMIIIMHVILLLDMAENMYYIEETHEKASYQLIIQSSIVMQTFFFLSGLFLAFTTQISNERNPKTWRSLPKAILLRFLRLAPVTYAVLLFTLTWFRFAPYGPGWQYTVNSEVIDCQRNWLSIIFFYLNYVDNMECLLQLWSTAVDLHMHIIGLTILLVLPAGRIRNIALWGLLLLGMVLPAVAIYAKDLDGSLVVRPISMHLETFFTDKTHNYLYKRTHTNIPNFVIGMAMGLLIHRWHDKPMDFSKYKKYSLLYWLLYPVLMFVLFTNVFLLWGEGNRGSLLTRMLFGAFQKPAWGLTMALITAGMIYQVEKVGVYRRVLEWGGWVPLARLSFCSYNAHVPLARCLAASSATLFNNSSLHMLSAIAGIVSLSFALAAILWLLVEAPCANLVGKLFPEKRSVLLIPEDKTE